MMERHANYNLVSSLLFDTIVKGDEVALQRVLSLGATIKCADENGLTPLHWATLTEESQMLIPALLSIGADPDAVDSCGRSPLHMLCALGHIYGASCILFCGVDVNRKTTDDGSTPLHYAAYSGNDELVRLLLAYGAQPNIRNDKGLSSFDVNRSSVMF